MRQRDWFRRKIRKDCGWWLVSEGVSEMQTDLDLSIGRSVVSFVQCVKVVLSLQWMDGWKASAVAASYVNPSKWFILSSDPNSSPGRTTQPTVQAYVQKKIAFRPTAETDLKLVLNDWRQLASGRASERTRLCLAIKFHAHSLLLSGSGVER